MLPGVVGSMQAMEAIKLILQIGDPLIGKMLYYDALTATTRKFKLRPDPECALCGASPTIKTLQHTEFKHTTTTEMKEITVTELKERIETNAIEYLLDVRMPEEHQAANLGGELIPLPVLSDSLDQIPKDQALVIYCKGGVRSAKACHILMEAGFNDVTNVIGGTEAWRREVDPSLPYA